MQVTKRVAIPPLVIVPLVAASALLAGSHVDGEAVAKPGQARAGLKPFHSCPQLVRYAKRHQQATSPPVVEGDFGAPGATTPQGGAEGRAPEPGYSGTNVQEQGVDEPDVVKSDGKLILALGDGKLHAVDAQGDEPRLLDSLSFRELGGDRLEVYPYELLRYGDRALVMASAYGPVGPAERSLIYPGYGRTMLVEVDVADPGNLKITRTFEVDGSYLSGRLNGSTARIVISSYPQFPIDAGGGGGDTPVAAAKRNWLPTGVLRNRVSGRKTVRPLMGCRDIRRPTNFSGLGMLTVLTVDLSKGLDPSDADTVMTYGDIVYGSPNALYVATQRWYQGTPSDDRLSEVSTEIHKFKATDSANTDYAASGEVPGFMLSQWSMSEHEGALRVASTTSPPWNQGAGGESESFVTVLRENGNRLIEAGSVGGLGQGEQIYAVRFIGETGYVVTFRQVDPLYTLDLSQPSDPTVVGELKIPGYSAYLHPVADGLLLGVGASADQQGRREGAQLSLFDVSDLSRPRRIASYEVSDGYTDVEYDHRAFLYWPPKQLAMIPVQVYNADTELSGATGFHIDPAGSIRRIADVTHGSPPGAYISRSLVIGNRVYTLSDRGLLSSDIDTLEPGSFVPWN